MVAKDKVRFSGTWELGRGYRTFLFGVILNRFGTVEIYFTQLLQRNIFKLFVFSPYQFHKRQQLQQQQKIPSIKLTIETRVPTKQKRNERTEEQEARRKASKTARTKSRVRLVTHEKRNFRSKQDRILIAKSCTSKTHEK